MILFIICSLGIYTNTWKKNEIVGIKEKYGFLWNINEEQRELAEKEKIIKERELKEKKLFFF